MKTKDAYNGSRRTGERFLRLWSELAQGVFPFIMEEVWELDYGHRLFVSVCEAVIDPKEFEYAKWCGNGRPKADRVSSRSPPHSKSSPYARPMNAANVEMLPMPIPNTNWALAALDLAIFSHFHIATIQLFTLSTSFLAASRP